MHFTELRETLEKFDGSDPLHAPLWLDTLQEHFEPHEALKVHRATAARQCLTGEAAESMRLRRTKTWEEFREAFLEVYDQGIAKEVLTEEVNARTRYRGLPLGAAVDRAVIDHSYLNDSMGVFILQALAETLSKSVLDKMGFVSTDDFKTTIQKFRREARLAQSKAARKPAHRAYMTTDAILVDSTKVTTPSAKVAAAVLPSSTKPPLSKNGQRKAKQKQRNAELEKKVTLLEAQLLEKRDGTDFQ